MNDLTYQGHTVILATHRWQKRKHHKKRINKKWAKRYGYHETNMMPHYQVVMFDNMLYMTRKTWEDLQKGINEKEIKDFCKSSESEG